MLLRFVFSATLALMVLVSFCGCAGAPSKAAVAAEAMALTANQAAYVLKNEYVLDQDPNKEVNWEPVFAAWDSFAKLHDLYATAIERGENPSAARMLEAFCLVVDAVPAQVATKIQIPGLCALEAP